MSEYLQQLASSLRKGGTPIGKPPGETAFIAFNKGSKIPITKSIVSEIEQELGDRLVIVPDPQCEYAITVRQANRVGLPSPRTLLVDAIA